VRGKTARRGFRHGKVLEAVLYAGTPRATPSSSAGGPMAVVAPDPYEIRIIPA